MAGSVIRVRRTEGYTVLPNGILRDPSLSLKTKGLFAIILSLPERWEYSVAGLAIVAGCGRDAIRSALKEMEQAGYLTRSQAQGENGKFSGVVYTIQDHARTEEKAEADAREAGGEESAAPVSGFPTPVSPTPVQPTAGNPTQLKKDLYKKDLYKKDLLNPLPPEGRRSAQASGPGEMFAPEELPIW